MSQSRGRSAKFGLVLDSRGVVVGATTYPILLELARLADEAPVWHSLWVGDSILSKPRLDALVLLGAFTAITRRVRLGVACLASTPLRNALELSYQWATLDFISHGRTIFVACQGAAKAPADVAEFAAFSVPPETRSRRMEEAIEIMRLVSTTESASYEGEFNRFEHVTVFPRPIQQPLPIWITANPDPSRPKSSESALRRVARLGDGWMTVLNTPVTFAEHLESIRGYAADEHRTLPEDFEACMYLDINVNRDRQTATAEAKQYLDVTYGTSFTEEAVQRRSALGNPDECMARLNEFIEAGATTITLRIAGGDQVEQMRRVTETVLPAFASMRV